jgi:hypothetical protein
MAEPFRVNDVLGQGSQSGIPLVSEKSALPDCFAQPVADSAV